MVEKVQFQGPGNFFKEATLIYDAAWSIEGFWIVQMPLLQFWLNQSVNQINQFHPQSDIVVNAFQLLVALQKDGCCRR
jgi:hypothetical protein